MAQERAKAYLQTAGAISYNKLMDEWEELQRQNREAESSSAWGGIIGSVGLPLIAALGGPISLAGAALASGVGSYVGSGIGADYAGGFRGPESISKPAFKSNLRREMAGKAETAEDLFEEGRTASALSSAASAYMLGGGTMPGTKAFSDAGGFAGTFVPSSAFGGMDLSAYAPSNLYQGFQEAGGFSNLYDLFSKGPSIDPNSLFKVGQ